MYFPQFLIGVVVTLGAVAVWTYSATGSVWLAVVWATISSLALQLGYFVSVLGLVYMSPVGKQTTDPDSIEPASHLSK
ncbi:hypothetical protein [Mesorhizobium sp.]|nr:hypothetical protein [Mesorhizobium sp.]